MGQVQETVPCGIYDVFISHYGPDTKTIFVKLLATRLVERGITVFYDDTDLDPVADPHAWEIMKATLHAAKIQVYVTRRGQRSFIFRK